MSDVKIMRFWSAEVSILSLSPVASKPHFYSEQATRKLHKKSPMFIPINKYIPGDNVSVHSRLERT